MADALIPGLDVSAFAGAASGLTTALFWLAVLVLLGGAAWLFTYWMSFNFKAVIRETINGRTFVYFDKIRLYKDKNGILRMQAWGSLFKFKKDPIPLVASEYIDITAKGKKIIEFFKTPDRQYIPIRADPDKINKIPGFDPFTSDQRAALIQEYREANSYVKKNWTEILLGIFPFIAVIMIIIVFMIFFDQAVSPTITLGNQNAEIQKQMMNDMDEFRDLCLNRVRLESQYSGVGNNTSPPKITPPPN